MRFLQGMTHALNGDSTETPREDNNIKAWNAWRDGKILDATHSKLNPLA